MSVDPITLKSRLEHLDALYADVVWGPQARARFAEAAALRERIVANGGVPFVSGVRSLLPISQLRFDSIVAEHASHVIVEACGLPELQKRLTDAFAKVDSSGTVIVRVRWPWDTQFFNVVRDLGLKVIAYHREVEHTLVPSLHVLDGGGDLVLLSGAAPPAAQLLTTEGLPYAWCDIDNLDPNKLVQEPLKRMADAVAERLGYAPEFVDIHGDNELQILSWYAPSGVGFTAQLQSELQHMLISYVPYDDVIDHAAVSTVFDLFAMADTRSRPRRTDRTNDRTVFA